MTTIYEHLEAFAGEIIQGWSVGSEGDVLPFQVVQLAGGPHVGTTTFATLGLSNFPLPAKNIDQSPRFIRHELLMVVPEEKVPLNIVGVIQQLGFEAMARKYAYLRGELIGPKGEIFPGHEPKALYASVPVYFPEEFWSVIVDGIGDVAFVWLVPLLDKEVDCIALNGWRHFESMLASADPDLVDYTRNS